MILNGYCRITGVDSRQEEFALDTLTLGRLDAARTLHDLRGVGLRLEALREDRVGQHAVRVSGQLRISFVWRDGDAYDVELVDYY